MNIVKSTGTFGFFTIISRLLGYLRDILIAIFLGTGVLADAFFVAFRIPNTFRRLFSEGTFNAAFVPSYSSELEKGKKKSNDFANNIFNFLFLALFFLVLIVQIFMPAFVSMIAPGFVDNFDKINQNCFLREFYLTFKNIFIMTYIYSDSKFCGKSETYVHNSFLYCTDIYSQSETSVDRNLPVLYLKILKFT